MIAQDYQLEASDLSGPITWITPALTTVTNGTGLASTIIAPAGHSFFRLQK
jgi:hypothetical protein